MTVDKELQAKGDPVGSAPVVGVPVIGAPVVCASAARAPVDFAEPPVSLEKLVAVCDVCGKEISTLSEIQSLSLSGRVIRDRVCRCRTALVNTQQDSRVEGLDVSAANSQAGGRAGSRVNSLTNRKLDSQAGSLWQTLTGESVRRRLTATGTMFEGYVRIEPLPAGTIIGGTYEIFEVIGQGGMGIVYKVRHQALGKILALKVLPSNLYNEKSWKRFQAEAKALAALKHPALVGVYDLGVHEGTTPYYTMDYLEGKSLQQLLLEDGPLTVQEAVEVFLKVLEGLKYAHDQNIVHRDIKPANIFLCGTASGGLSVKLLDFGIAKLSHLDADTNQSLTASGDIFGSPYYMSPEQCLGAKLDLRSDIYSIGCSLYEALTGEVPFEGETALATLMMHQKSEAPVMSAFGLKFPGRLEKVVARCLAKNPDDRPSSASELATELKLVLTRPEEGKYCSHSILNWVEPKGPEQPIDLEKVPEEEDEKFLERPAGSAAGPIISGAVYASLIKKQEDREKARLNAPESKFWPRYFGVSFVLSFVMGYFTATHPTMLGDMARYSYRHIFTAPDLVKHEKPWQPFEILFSPPRSGK